MLRITRTVAGSLAILIVAGTIAPAAANAALSDGAYNQVSYNAQKKGANVTFQLYNKGEGVQQVKVAGQVYTLQPHSAQKITAPAGSEVYAASESKSHHDGELLFSVTEALKGNTVSID